MKQIVVFIFFGLAMATENRVKRFLIFPAATPTRMQLIMGVGLPVDLEYESVTIGFVVKSEYFLPDNTTVIEQFLRDPFEPWTRPLQRRRRDTAGSDQHNSYDLIENQTNDTESNTTSNDHYEKYNVEAVEVDTRLTSNEVNHDDDSNDWNEDDEDDEEQYTPADYGLTTENDFSTARWTLYKGIETMAEKKGLSGRPCMLRSICESAHAPFTHNSGILAELMHIIMTPSSSKDTMIDHSQNEYYRAEEIGRSGAPCDKVFRECTTSVLGKFSGIYSSVENIIEMLA